MICVTDIKVGALGDYNLYILWFPPQLLHYHLNSDDTKVYLELYQVILILKGLILKRLFLMLSVQSSFDDVWFGFFCHCALIF